MKKILIISFFMFFPIVCFGQSRVSYADSIRRSYDSYVKQGWADYEEQRDKMQKEYDEYVKTARAEFEAFKKSISNVWGRDEVITSTQKTWVEYGKDMKSRSIVDFDKGKVTVEVAIEVENLTDTTAVNEVMSDAVAGVLDSRGSTCEYPSEVEEEEPLTNEPILDGLVDVSSYSISEDKTHPKVDVHDTKDVAEAITTQSPKTVVTSVGDDGKDRLLVRLEFDLVADNLSKTALMYKKYVDEFSVKFRIEQPLIYAVMEQESSFNPAAVSPAQAYGLMQLVAASGGRHAYGYVYGRDWIPTKSYLLNPRNNIELGTAYLRILMDMFKNVTDPDCRRLCVIAGYNTGAGNVSRSFTGAVRVGGAVPFINKYDYDQLYRHLTTRLNSQEARNYVSGVTRRREKYLPNR